MKRSEDRCIALEEHYTAWIAVVVGVHQRGDRWGEKCNF
jgi:hypothetical protein